MKGYLGKFPVVEAVVYVCLGALPALWSYYRTGWTALALVCLWGAGVTTYAVTRHAELAGFLTLVARHYFVLAAPAKIVLAIHFPELTVGLLNVNLTIFEKYLEFAALSYLWGAIGVYGALAYWAVLTSAGRTPRRRPKNQTHQSRVDPKRPSRERRILPRLLIASLALILLKVVLIEAFDFSKPGVVPKSIGIQGVTGLLNTLAIHGSLWLTLILVVKAGENRERIPYLYLIPLVVNILVDLSNGYKFSLISVAIIILIVDARRGRAGIIGKLPLPKNRKFRYAMFLLGVAAYPAIDAYSDLRAAGSELDIFAVALSAFTNLHAEFFFLPVTEVLRRINGIDAFIITHSLLESREFDWTSLLGTDVVQQLRFAVYGFDANEVVSALGSTIFNAAVRLGGSLYVTAVMVVITTGFCLLVEMLMAGLRRDDECYRLMYGIIAIEFTRLFFSAGDISGSLKILIAYMAMAHLWVGVNRIRFARFTGQRSERHDTSLRSASFVSHSGKMV